MRFQCVSRSFRIQANNEGKFAASISHTCPCWGNFFIYNISCLSHCSTTSCRRLCTFCSLLLTSGFFPRCHANLREGIRKRSCLMAFYERGPREGIWDGRFVFVESISSCCRIRFNHLPKGCGTTSQGAASRFCCRAVATQELSLREGCEWMAPWQVAKRQQKVVFAKIDKIISSQSTANLLWLSGRWI